MLCTHGTRNSRNDSPFSIFSNCLFLLLSPRSFVHVCECARVEFMCCNSFRNRRFWSLVWPFFWFGPSVFQQTAKLIIISMSPMCFTATAPHTYTHTHTFVDKMLNFPKVKPPNILHSSHYCWGFARSRLERRRSGTSENGKRRWKLYRTGYFERSRCRDT